MERGSDNADLKQRIGAPQQLRGSKQFAHGQQRGPVPAQPNTSCCGGPYYSLLDQLNA
jgi:hypothetical protein